MNTDLILDCLRELGNRQLQENLWMGKMPGQQSSFEEAVEGLFTDSGLDGALRNSMTGFSKELESILQELEREVAKVDAHSGPANVIGHPAMSRIRELAVIAVKLLQVA